MPSRTVATRSLPLSLVISASSVDQANEESPIVAIIQTGSHLLFRAAHGTYEGDLKDGQLVGTWTQGPKPAPLVFKRAKPQ